MMNIVYPSLIEQPEYSTSLDDYVRWVSARKAMHKAISAAIRGGLVIDRALVLGAGTCRDLPMDFLLDKCGEIVLVDVAQEAFEESLNFTQGSEHKVKRVIADVTGLGANAICSKSALDRALSNRRMPKELAALGEFDLVVSDLMISVMSQPFMLDERNREEKDNYSDRITAAHLGDIERLCRLDGYAVIAHDLCPCGTDDDEWIKANNRILYNHPHLNPRMVDMNYSHITQLLIAGKVGASCGTLVLHNHISDLIRRNTPCYATPFWWSFYLGAPNLCCTYSYQNIKKR